MAIVNHLSTLEEEIATHPAVHHPFLRRFSEGRVSLPHIRAFGLQHYQLVKVFTTYMTNLLPRLPDQDAAQLFRTVFDDEFGQHTIFNSHPALYRNFLKALGLDDADWGRMAPLPETSGFIEFHLELTRSGHFLSALGAIGPGHEYSIPTMFTYLVEGLRRSRLVSEEALSYFTLHIEEDKEHAKVFNQLLERYMGTEESRYLIRTGVLKSLQARERFWSGLQRAVFGGT
ncbi:MAG: iron-containing redox enzyme family protein [Nitrospirota bacterium]